MIKKFLKLLSSRFLYLMLGIFLVLSVYAVKAAWDSTVISSQRLTPQLWNDVVVKLQDLDSRISTGQDNYQISCEEDWGTLFCCRIDRTTGETKCKISGGASWSQDPFGPGPSGKYYIAVSLGNTYNACRTNAGTGETICKRSSGSGASWSTDGQNLW